MMFEGASFGEVKGVLALEDDGTMPPASCPWKFSPICHGKFGASLDGQKNRWSSPMVHTLCQSKALFSHNLTLSAFLFA